MVVKVKPKNNFRNIDDDNAGLHLMKGREGVLKDRQLKSNNVRKMLFDGAIQVTEGDLNFVFKNAKCKIKEDNPDKIIFKENGKEFIKYLDTGECLPFTEHRKEEYFLEIEEDEDEELNIGGNKEEGE